MAYPKKDYKTVVIRVPQPIAATLKAVVTAWERAHKNRPENPWQIECIEEELTYIAREGHSQIEVVRTYLDGYSSTNSLRPGEKRISQPRWSKAYELLCNLRKLL